MRKKILPKLLLWVGIPCMLFTSCVDDRYLVQDPPVQDQSFVEQFDTMTAAYNRGWRTINKSEPIGVTDWSNPDIAATPFVAYSSKYRFNGYAWADYQSTSAAQGTISSWLVSPLIMMQNGDKIVFYTRTELYDDGAGDSTDYSNRLQVRMNSKNTSLNVGSGDNPGDFDVALLDVNPSEVPFSLLDFNNGVRNAYPHRWTRFEATVYGLNKPTQGRFAFRYYLHDAGSNGNGSSVGVDSVAYIGKK